MFLFQLKKPFYIRAKRSSFFIGVSLYQTKIYFLCPSLMNVFCDSSQFQHKYLYKVPASTCTSILDNFVITAKHSASQMHYLTYTFHLRFLKCLCKNCCVSITSFLKYTFRHVFHLYDSPTFNQHKYHFRNTLQS